MRNFQSKIEISHNLWHLKIGMFLFLTLAYFQLIHAQSFPQSTIYQGIEVTCNVTHLNPTKSENEFYEGDDVIFQFKIADTLTKEGLSGVYPAAWLGAGYTKESIDCQRKIEMFLSNSVFKRAELDMNVYYVMTLNGDASITVVDPLFGYGGTKMLASVQLNSPGMDWAILDDQNHFFVSLPTTEEIAVVQTSDWIVTKNIKMPGVPVHTVLQPDGAFLWVTYVTKEKDSEDITGVVAINTATMEIKANIPTGRGWHELAISEDNHYCFVSNAMDGTVTIIDIPTLSKVKDIYTSPNPTAIAWSSQAQALLVGHKESGLMEVIDAKLQEKIATITAEPGIEQVTFAPDGRFGFVVNPAEDVVHIIDIVNNQIVQTADVEEEPHAVSYTDGLAYISHRGSEIVLMIPLGSIGTPNTPVQVIDFPGGENPPGKTDFPAIAPGIVKAAGESAVLVANPLDQAVYYYMEGMAAPMGNFSNYGKQPRAVMIVDRTLKETTPGVYQTTVKLQDAGQFDIAFFMNAPRLTHCFQLEVKLDEAAAQKREIAQYGSIKINYLSDSKTLKKGEDEVVKFQARDRITNQLVVGLTDVRMLLMDISGRWFRNINANETNEAGTYEVAIDILKEGYYQFSVECPSRTFSFNHCRPTLFNVVSTPETYKK